MLSRQRERLMTCLVFAAAGLTGDALLAQSPQRQAPVEVTTPSVPIPVTADGKQFLVYELHVTNFAATPLALHAVDVYPGGATEPLIATLRDSALHAAVRVIGGAMPMNGGSMTSEASNAPPVIGAGQRAVVFLMLEIPARTHVPAMLRHRLTFSIVDTSAEAASTSSTSILDSVMTLVNRVAVPILRAPMNGGDWLVGEGLSNSSDHRRTIVAVNGRAWLSQRFAIDFVKIGANGNTWHDDRRNDNYWGFGEPVLAVANGEVVTAVDSFADNPRGQVPPVTLTNIAGNHVILRIGPAQYVLYAHLQHGSVRVRSGQRVKRGDVLASLGNSGNTSGPHLHFQLMDAPSALAAEGIPFMFEQFTFLGFGRDYEPNRHPSIPRQRELPLGDAVVRPPERSAP